MSLQDRSDDERQVKKPENGIVTITRSVTGTPTLENVKVRGYSSSFGGQLISGIDFSVKDDGGMSGSIVLSVENGEKIINKLPETIDSGVIEFRFDTRSAKIGSDHIVEYLLDGTYHRFFFQNGVYAADRAGDLSFRASAEIERFSDTFSDGQNAKELTDFSNTNRRGTGDFVFVSDSSPYTKHGEEPIPYFGTAPLIEGSSTLEFPAAAFDDRNGSVILVLAWVSILGEDFPVARLTQGGNTVLEVRNDQEDIRLESDFASQVLYKSGTHTGENIVVVEARIDDSGAIGSVNREEETKVSLAGSYASGTTELEINPEEKTINPKLFDVIAYDEAISSESLDRVAKQLSYFYKTDLTGAGIQNHLFYNEKVENYDMYVASSPTTRYDFWKFPSSGTAVAVDSRGKVVVGTDGQNEVHRLDSGGSVIWTFDGHTDSIEAVEAGTEKFSYSASRDGTAKKFGPQGTPVWNFDQHTSAVNDIALYKDLAVYTASDDETVRRIVSGTEDWSFTFTGHKDSVTSVAVDPDGYIYSAAVNGELRKIDNDGNETYLITPFSAELPGAEIKDLALRSDTELYVVAGDMIKKLDATDGSEIWKQDVFGSNPNKTAKLDAVAASPKGTVFAAENLEHKVIEFDDTGSKVSEFSGDIQGDIHDLSVQPGTVEPHWR